MSTPLLWVFTPLITGMALLTIPRRSRLKPILGTGVLLLLSWAAWIIPTGETLSIGPISLQISDTLNILGRKFILVSDERGLVILIYLIAAFWFIGTLTVKVNRLFISLGLGIVAAIVAALMVEPFLYAALLIEVAVLLAIPILAPVGKPIGHGVLRFLIFQTLALPLVLFTGWMLTGVEVGTADPALTLRAGTLLGLGFAFLLAIFPFHSWIPLLAGETHPYEAGFVFVMQSTVVLLFGIDLITRYSWLHSSAEVYALLRLVGTFMVVIGGISAAFQNHAGRMMGYAVIAETGYSLLAASLGDIRGMEIFGLLFLPRVLGFGIWAITLSVLHTQAGSLQFSSIQGAGRKYPVLAIGLLLAQLTIVGLPMLAGFPVKLALFEALAGQSSQAALWTLLGSAFLLIGVLHTLAVLTVGERWQFTPGVSRGQYLLLGAGTIAMMGVGIQPQAVYPVLNSLLVAIGQLAH